MNLPNEITAQMASKTFKISENAQQRMNQQYEMQQVTNFIIARISQRSLFDVTGRFDSMRKLLPCSRAMPKIVRRRRLQAINRRVKSV